MNLHIGNLNINMIDSDVPRVFSVYGEVSSVQLVRDKLNNRSGGRTFIEMPVTTEAKQAIAAFNSRK